MARTNYRLIGLLASLLISALGDSVASLSLVLKAADGSVSWYVTEVFLAQLIPPLLIVPFIGAFVDRTNARIVWVFGLLAQAMFFVAAGVVVGFHFQVALVGAANVVAVISGAAGFKLLPRVAGSIGGHRASSYLVAVISFAGLLGPAVGAAGYGRLGPEPLFLVNAVTFVFVGLMAAAVVPRVDETVNVGGLPLTGALAGVRALVEIRLLRLMVPVMALVMLATAIEGVAGVFYLRSVTETDAQYGLLLSAWALGSIVGSLLAGRRFAGGREAQVVLAGGLLISLAILVEGLVPLPTVIGLAFVFGGLGNGAHNVGIRSLIYSHVPEDLHGRTWAYFGALSNTVVGVGFLLGTPSSVLDARTLVVLSGCLGSVAVMTGAMRLTRATRIGRLNVRGPHGA